MGLGARRPQPRPGARLLPALVVSALVAVACTTPPPRPGPPRAGPSPGPTPATPALSVLRLSTAEPGSLDPAQLDATDDLLLAAQLFDGLVAYEPQTQDVVPAAARDWEVRDGGRTFVFHLRPGGRFHDGSPVRARDFVSAWTRLADPITSAPYSFLLEPVQGFDRYQRTLSDRGIQGLSAPDDLRFEVRLAEPWPGFVALLGHPALSPVPSSAKEDEIALRPVGNGPFRLTAPLTPGGPFTMERFPDYAGPPPIADQLVFRVFDDPAEAWPAFLAGDLDQAPIPSAALDDAESRFGSAGIVTLARVLGCGLNQLDPRLRSRDLGVAISLAIDRDAIATLVYGGVAVPATGIVPPSIPGHDPEACGNRCVRDEERARELVKEIPKRSRSFDLDHVASETGGALAELVVAQLAEVGLEVRPREHDEREYRALLEREGEELFCVVWSADYPRERALLEPPFASDTPDNLTGFSDRKVDRLLERAREEGSAGTRRELYARIERRVLTLMPLVPVVWFRSHLAVRPGIEGFSVDPLGLFDAARLSPS